MPLPQRMTGPSAGDAGAEPQSHGSSRKWPRLRRRMLEHASCSARTRVPSWFVRKLYLDDIMSQSLSSHSVVHFVIEELDRPKTKGKLWMPPVPYRFRLLILKARIAWHNARVLCWRALRVVAGSGREEKRRQERLRKMWRD